MHEHAGAHEHENEHENEHAIATKLEVERTLGWVDWSKKVDVEGVCLCARLVSYLETQLVARGLESALVWIRLLRIDRQRYCRADLVEVMPTLGLLLLCRLVFDEHTRTLLSAIGQPAQEPSASGSQRAVGKRRRALPIYRQTAPAGSLGTP